LVSGVRALNNEAITHVYGGRDHGADSSFIRAGKGGGKLSHAIRSETGWLGGKVFCKASNFQKKENESGQRCCQR
jgi:hypothetical protein